MELMQSGIGTIAPTENLIMDWNWALYPKLRNSKGELFLESYLPPDVTEKQCYDDKGTHWPFSTSDKSMYIDIAITKEIKAGRTTKHGGVYMDLSGVTEKMVEEMPSSGGRQVWEMTKQYLLENGIDVTKEPLEIATCGHAINGGLRINENGETTIAGLYAAGEAAAGPHGADRLGGNMLVTGQVFGARAGIAAAAKKGKVNFSEQKISDLQKQMDDIAISQGIHDVLELKKSIQQAMWTDGMNIRSEIGLKHCLEVIKNVKEKIQEGLIIRNPGDLKNALELINLADVGEIVATVARMRKESRGSHYREDFPQKDPDWAKSIIIKKVDGQIHTTTGKLSEM
jgi:succinate dehydrogenase/fumarate reductase flavoprotein subunit